MNKPNNFNLDPILEEAFKRDLERLPKPLQDRPSSRIMDALSAASEARSKISILEVTNGATRQNQYPWKTILLGIVILIGFFFVIKYLTYRPENVRESIPVKHAPAGTIADSTVEAPTPVNSTKVAPIGRSTINYHSMGKRNVSDSGKPPKVGIKPSTQTNSDGIPIWPEKKK